MFRSIEPDRALVRIWGDVLRQLRLFMHAERDLLAPNRANERAAGRTSCDNFNLWTDGFHTFASCIYLAENGTGVE